MVFFGFGSAAAPRALGAVAEPLCWSATGAGAGRPQLGRWARAAVTELGTAPRRRKRFPLPLARVCLDCTAWDA